METIPSWVPYALLSVAVVVLTYLATHPPAPGPTEKNQTQRQQQNSVTQKKKEPPPAPEFNPLLATQPPQSLASPEQPRQWSALPPKIVDLPPKPQSSNSTSIPDPQPDPISYPHSEAQILAQAQAPESPKSALTQTPPTSIPEPIAETLLQVAPNPPTEKTEPIQEALSQSTSKSHTLDLSQGDISAPRAESPLPNPTPQSPPPETESPQNKGGETPRLPEFNISGGQVKQKSQRKPSLISLFDQLKEGEEPPKLPSNESESSGSESSEGTSPPLDTSGAHQIRLSLTPKGFNFNGETDLLAGLNALKELSGSESGTDSEIESRERSRESASGSDSKSHSGSASSSEGERPVLDEEESEEGPDKKLIKGFGVADDINKAGLSRAKKFTTVKGKKIIQMEDTNYVASPFEGDQDVALFCVFDGHGGLTASEELVKTFPAVFSKHWNALENPKEKLDFTDLWKKVYAEVDVKLKEIEDCHFCGSTCTTVLAWKTPDGSRRVQSANVGDSAVFIHADGQSVMLSVDHKVTNEQERERMIASGVAITQYQTRLIGGLALARALGDHFLKDDEKNTGLIGVPFVSEPLTLTNKVTQLVLASDGLWDIVPGRNVFKVVNASMDPTQAAKKLLTAAISSSQCDDNVTVIVVKF